MDMRKPALVLWHPLSTGYSSMAPMRKILGRPDVVSAFTLLALAIFARASARGLPWGTLHQPGPGFFPRGLAVLLFALTLLLLVRGLASEAGSIARLWPDRGGRQRVAIMLATLLGYVLVLDMVGYLIATAGMFLILLRWVGRQGWVTTLITAAVAAGGSYVLFARWLMISLPAGLWAP